MLSNNNLTNTISNNNLANNVTSSTASQTGSPQSNSVSSSALHPSRGVSSSPQASGSSPYGLEKGQVVRGEIIDLKNNEVSVKMEDGQVIRGRLAATGYDLSIGNKVTLRVEDSSSQSLTLKLLPGDSSAYTEATVDKALEAANLSKTDRNKSMVAELLNARMSIDKSTLANLARQLVQFPGSSVRTLVFLNQNSLPVNSTNVEFMESFFKSSGKVLSELTALSDSIGGIFLTGDDTAVKYKLLSILFPGAGPGEESLNGQTSGAAAAKNELNTLNLQNGPQNIENALTDSAAPSNVLNLPGGASSPGGMEPFSVHTGLMGISPGEGSSLPAEAIQNNLPALPPDIAGNLPVLEGSNAFTGAAPAPDGVSSLLNPEERLQFLALLRENLPGDALPDSVSRGIREGDISASELLSRLSSFLSEKSDLPGSSAEKILSSQGFSRLLSSSLLSEWSLTPEDLAKPSSVSGHFESLLKQLKDIRELAENTPFRESPALQNQAAHVTDTLNFMNTLNHLFTYLQLPVKLKNQYADSELYVYSNKKSELDITEGVKVVLHLKMEHLGPVDVAVELRQNRLKNSFYLENGEVRELLASHMEALETRLESRGYQVRTEYYNREKGNTPADTVKDQLLSQSSPLQQGEKKRYHFDKRA